jgi:benzoyl-CoA-dihydrodiol lyase
VRPHARSFFAIIEPGNAFAGTLAELALAADRSYMLDDDEQVNSIQLSVMNRGAYPMSNGLTRLQSRFFGHDDQLKRGARPRRPLRSGQARDAGLVTFAPDEIDWDDEVRLAIESRAALSPDALTGMEANLRFVGPETMETKIFGRLTAWQNWIFQRPNAVGPKGALTSYGTNERANLTMAD